MKPAIKFVVFILFISLFIFISCKKETSCEGCKGNKPPIAIAGPDQVITLPTDSVSLDGNASNYPDGTISSFLWTKISGPASFIINNSSAAGTVVKNLVAGTYQFELKATDNGGLSAKDTMKVIVDSVMTTNHPPIANAGADQIITLPTNNINLDGSSSADPDNNITSYTWTKISGPTSFNISNTNAVQTQVTNFVQGVYQFELKVTDAYGLFSKDTMQVIVNPESPPPTAGDYFPLTLNSNWKYGWNGGAVPDILTHTVISYSPTFSGNVYSTFFEQWSPGMGTADDSLYYRKPGGDYYQYIVNEEDFGFENATFGEYIFLKDNVMSGITWQSPTFSGTLILTGMPATGYIKMTLLQKAVPATVGAFNFPDVIKMRYDYFISLQPGTPFRTKERWFAKGVGFVYDNSNIYFPSFLEVTSYQVY